MAASLEQVCPVCVGARGEGRGVPEGLPLKVHEEVVFIHLSNRCPCKEEKEEKEGIIPT